MVVTHYIYSTSFTTADTHPLPRLVFIYFGIVKKNDEELYVQRCVSSVPRPEADVKLFHAFYKAQLYYPIAKKYGRGNEFVGIIFLLIHVNETSPVK